MTTDPAAAVATIPVTGYNSVGVILSTCTCSSRINRKYVVTEAPRARATAAHQNPYATLSHPSHDAPQMRLSISISVAKAMLEAER